MCFDNASGVHAGLAVRAEISYIMVKPDGVQRGLVGEIIGRFERKGFQLKALQMRKCTREIAEEHYKDLKEKPFFKDLVDYILSGPVVAMVNPSSSAHVTFLVDVRLGDVAKRLRCGSASEIAKVL